ncbi:hypothetical protein [Streptomyces sp. NPDC059092]|uniref:hypothetical protein n=1 Tax=Streptomyces sp. NPDC059092 TaxID=3346725 RepID=UPI00369C5201
MKKSDREIMEIFEALDATECAPSAAALVGVDPKTVRRYARMRDAGRPTGGPVIATSPANDKGSALLEGR